MRAAGKQAAACAAEEQGEQAAQAWAGARQDAWEAEAGESGPKLPVREEAAKERPIGWARQGPEARAWRAEEEAEAAGSRAWPEAPAWQAGPCQAPRRNQPTAGARERLAWAPFAGRVAAWAAVPQEPKAPVAERCLAWPELLPAQLRVLGTEYASRSCAGARTASSPR